MKTSQLEVRVQKLEKAMEKLQSHGRNGDGKKRQWWIEDAGRFANDPVFDEIVKLGREYRYRSRKTTAKRSRGA